MTVLRDGTWSFPVVINNDLFPFPLWRPGFIVVRAQSATDDRDQQLHLHGRGARARRACRRSQNSASVPTGGASRRSRSRSRCSPLGIGALIAFAGAMRRLRCRCARLAADLQPQFAQERVAVRLAAQEVAHEHVAIDDAAALEDLVAVVEARRAIEARPRCSKRVNMSSPNTRDQR